MDREDLAVVLVAVDVEDNANGFTLALKWAKLVLISICSLLVVILITMVLALSSKLSTVLIVGSLIMATLSAIITIYLISSKDLNRYFVFKRQASCQ